MLWRDRHSPRLTANQPHTPDSWVATATAAARNRNSLQAATAASTAAALVVMLDRRYQILDSCCVCCGRTHRPTSLDTGPVLSVLLSPLGPGYGSKLSCCIPSYTSLDTARLRVAFPRPISHILPLFSTLCVCRLLADLAMPVVAVIDLSILFCLG